MGTNPAAGGDGVLERLQRAMNDHDVEGFLANVGRTADTGSQPLDCAVRWRVLPVECIDKGGAVATKADFRADEWSTVVEAPVLAGLRVVGAHRGGTIRESLAIGKVYTEARRAQGQSELLDELASSPPAVDTQRLQSTGDIAGASSDRLREALRVLNEKGSAEDVEAYKRFVTDVAQAAAEAHKEGGFIGIGGKQISDEEKAALDEIRAVLD